MGAGSFALPWAFSKMGYIAGPVFLTIFLGLSVYSIELLVDCACWLRKQQKQQTTSPQQLTYVDVARSAFGPMGATLSYVTAISASIGVCGSYLVFVAVNLESLLSSSVSQPQGHAHAHHPPFRVLIWTVAMPLAVILSSVRDPKRFAVVSFWGDVSVVAGMLAVVVYGVAAAADSGSGLSSGSIGAGRSSDARSSCVAVGSLDDMALAFGSIGYLFLVHFLVLPIESSMAAVDGGNEDGNRLDEIGGSIDHNPPQSATIIHALHTSSGTAANDHDHRHHKNRFQKVVRVTFAICGGIGGLFGIAGYLMFGAGTQEIVLLNVQGSFGMAIVQFLLCVDLLLTYPVVMRPSIDIVEQQWSMFLRKQNRKSSSSPAPNEDASTRVALIPSSNAYASPSCNKRNTPSTFEIDDDEATGYGTANVPIDNDHNSKTNNNTSNNADTDGGLVLVEWKTHATVCLALGGIAAGAATFVPAFGLLSGLVGGVSQTFLAFVLPPLVWAKQRETTLVRGCDGRSNRDTHDTDDECCHCTNDDDGTTTGWSFLRILPWRELALVLCGFGLILWTLRSTWIELGGGGN